MTTARSTQRTSAAALVAAILALVAVACSDSNPTTPTPGPLALSCPAAIVVDSPLGQPVTVTYAKPTLTGGAIPITGSCSRDAGTGFPVGVNTVTCSVRDAQEQTASCAFAVTVRPPPSLTVSRLVAFGDSITEGVDASCHGSLAAVPFEQSFAWLRPALASDPWSYPNVLRTILKSRYPLDAPVIVNSGVAGEYADQGADRLPEVLSTHRPDVVLLLHGTNDVVQHYDTDDLIDDLRDMIRTARGARANVLLSTLVPQKLSPCRNYLDPQEVPPVNTRIAQLAASENVRLVDSYGAFIGNVGGLIGADGLHPTEAGYRVLAEQFADGLRQFDRPRLAGR